MVLCKWACAHLIWEANFSLISKTDLFTWFHIVFQISFQISFQIYTTTNIAMFWMCQNFCSVLYMYIDSYFLSLIQKWVMCLYLQVWSFINRLQICLFKFTSLSILFHLYRDEPIGRWGENITPQENHLTHPQAELGLSHMWPVRGSNLHQQHRWVDRIIKSVEISGFTHSVTGLSLQISQLAKPSRWINRRYGCCMPAVAFCEPSTCTSRAKIVFDSCHAKLMMFRLFSI